MKSHPQLILRLQLALCIHHIPTKRANIPVPRVLQSLELQQATQEGDLLTPTFEDIQLLPMIHEANLTLHHHLSQELRSKTVPPQHLQDWPTSI